MRRHCCVILILLLAAMLQADVIYTEEFNNTGKDIPLPSVGWTCLATGAGANAGSVVEYAFQGTDTDSRNWGMVAAVGSADYGYYAPSRQTKSDTDGREYSLAGPALIYTGEVDDVMLSTLEEISFDARMDGIETDAAKARFAIKMSGQWYVSTFQYTDADGDNEWEAVSLTLDNWMDGNNWQVLNVTVSETAGAMTVGGVVGGSLNGLITDFGLFIETGNAGDHSRCDTYTVSAVPVARGAAYSPTPSDDDSVDSTLVSQISWQGPLTNTEDGGDPNLVSVDQFDITYYSKNINAIADDDPNFNNPANNIVVETNVSSPYTVSLDFDEQFYWRIDTHTTWDSNAVTGAGLSGVIEGTIWKFSTLPSAPFIIEQPSDERVFQTDADVVLSCTFSSASAPTVLWYMVGDDNPLTEGGDIVTAITDDGNNQYTATLQILTPVPENDGEYYCVIDNGTAATSETVYLIVNQLLAQYDFDGTLAPAAGSIADAPIGVGMTIDGLAEPNELLTTPAAVSYTTGVDGIGQAVVLDPNVYVDFGTDMYPKAGSLTDGIGRGLDAGTIICWVKPETTGAVLANYNDGGLTGMGLTLSGADTEVRIYVRGENGGLTPTDTQGQPDRPDWDITDGAWHLLAVTWQAADTASVYVDGQRVDLDPTSDTAPYAAWQRSVLLGASRTSANREILNSFYSGAIDNLRIYNYRLDIDSSDLFSEEYYNNTGIVPCTNSDFAGNEFNFDNTGSSYCRVDLSDFAVFASSWMADGLWVAP